VINQVLLAEALDALCAPLGYGQLWADGGPTSKVAELRSMRRLDTRSRVLIHVAWAIWNESGDVHFSELLALEPSDLRALLGLIQAVKLEGDLALEIWTAGQRERARKARSA
jgi:hypothetical protein